MLSPSLWVCPHPDDEIWPAAAMTKHLAPGQEVHALWLTSGSASGVIDDLNGLEFSSYWDVLHNPAAEGYPPLTPASLGESRVEDAFRAARQLALGYLGTLTTHLGHLQDGGVTVADAKAAILAVCDAIAPGASVRLKAPSPHPEWEVHPDHRAAGTAIIELGTEQPARFGDRRHYLTPTAANWSTTPPTVPGVPLSWDIADAGGSLRVRNACRAHLAWAPPYSHAAGGHSVEALLSTIMAAPRSRYHAS